MREYFNNKIFILDDVLSRGQCQELILFHNQSETSVWRDTNPMLIDMKNRFLASKVNQIIKNVNKYLGKKLEVDWCEIVLWPINSRQDLHKDISSNDTVFTSITYLNDNYSGGKTYIENDMEFYPKVGRTVCFDGNFYRHGVTQVLSADRYTLPIWYKLIS